MKNKILFFFLLSVKLCLPSYSVNVSEHFLFSNISLDQGLSQSTVLDIVQDSLGYIWMATQNGLNRYDGYKFSVFKPDLSDEKSISSSYHQNLCVDWENRIWIGGENGASYYDYDLGGFKNYDLKEIGDRNFVSGIVVDKQKQIWISTKGGAIYLYDNDTDCFSKVSDRTFQNTVSFIEEIVDKGNQLLICSPKGLFSFNKKSRELVPVLIDGKSRGVHDVKIGKDASLWVGTADDGLYLLDHEYQVSAHFTHSANSRESILGDKIRALAIDNTGLVWIGTFNGLSILNPFTRAIDNYVNENDRESSLSHNSVRSIFCDNKNGMWVGTFYGGVNYFHKDNIKFNTINKYSQPMPLNDNIINFICEGKDKRIWIGSNDRGINCWNPQTNQISFHQIKKDNENIMNSVKAILALNDGSFLIGCHWGGLGHYIPASGKMTIYKKNDLPETLSDDRISSLLKDRKGNIWVGTYNGLQQFDIQTGKFTLFETDSKGKKLTSESILSLFEDSFGRIWIGTFNGLNIYHKEADLIESFYFGSDRRRSFGQNEITCIFEDSNRHIWIGTRNGLNLFDEVSRSFRNYTEKEGLINSTICAMTEDSNNNLWISSNAGLMKYNLIRETWHYYNKNDGLPTSQFNQSSVCKMSDGKILFGSIKGIVIFDPDKIGDETSDNNIILFSDLLLYNHPVRPNDETGILKSHISKCDQIVLNANQRMFTLRFTSINYNANNNVSYAYMLEGFNETWTYITNRELTFSELPVGKYRLRIKSNTINNELPSEVSIYIIISPPWWCSIPMIILYLVMMIIAAICIFKIIQERIRLYNELNQEKIEKQKVEELQNMQTQFFINVSHELKTPLTLITSPLENLLDVCKSNEWQKKQLELVYRNAQSLSDLIDELINFEKAEQGQTKLRVAQEEIVDFIRKVYSSFYLLAKGKNIDYQIEIEFPSLITLFDPFILKNILNNFLSNAFKFTPANGSITVSVFSENDYLIIAVKDTGIGISKERQKYIFDRFYTAAPDIQIGGTGIGLAYSKLLAELHHGFLKVSSEERKGALFSFYLPLSETVYHISEYGESPNISIDYKPHYYLNPVKNVESTDFSLSDADQAKQSILIVDDNLNMTEYLSENLSQIYNVSIAHDGQQATEKLSGHTYDLIICDVMMPHVNGLQFCKRIRQNITTSHIPIILLSAKSDLEHAIYGLSIGADDYIAKPFSLKLLKTKIQNILLTRHRLKELYASSPAKPTKTAYFSKDQEFLTKATKFIEDHLAESEFSVNELAYMMGLSRSALYLRFKAITGESISDFIQKIRFRTAMELLNTGRYNVSEISMMTGFSSPSYFTKVFKKHFGYLPTEYIKQVNVTE